LKVTVNVRDTDSTIDAEFGVKVVDNNRRNYCLACSWFALAEESLVALIKLPLKFV
jgi:hypothetical protein